MRLPVSLIAAFAVIALPAAVSAAPCKDAKGKFIKCPTTATTMVKPATTTKKKVAAKTTAKKVTKATKSSGGMAGKCRDAKGRFAKCGTPGTHPA